MKQQIKIEAVVNIPNDLVVIKKVEFEKLQEQLLELQNQIQQRELLNRQSTTVDKSNAELLEVSDVAKRLKCNKNKVYGLIKSGQLMGLKLGRMKVTSIELNDFLIRNAGKDLTDPYNVKEL